MDVTQSNKPVQLVTKREAANSLRVSVRTIDRYIAEKRLDGIRISTRATRITRQSLDALRGVA